MKASVTRAAEGFDRRSFTVEEVLRMQEAGVISDDENYELIKGTDITLAIEVAPTSLRYDRGLKAQIYARCGVRELWAIDASRRLTRIHTGPGAGVWEHVIERASGDALTCPALRGFSAKLDQI